jgi:hypothetical protein
MRFLCLAPLALAALVAPAWAKDAKPEPTDCAGLFDSLDLLKRGPQTSIEDTATGCIITNVYFGSSYSRTAIGQITLDTDDLFGAIAGHSRPAKLELSVTDIRVSPEMADSPVTAYVLETQQAPFDLHLAYSWDEASGDFDLDDLSMTMPTLGSITLKARLAGVTDMPEALDSPADFARGNIEKLSLTLDNRGLFTAFAVPVLVGNLPYDEDPRPAIATAQQAITTFIAALPDTQIDQASKAVLTRFVADFPKPNGFYHVEIAAKDQPVPLEGLLDFNGPTDLIGLLSKFTLTAEFKPLAE